jgi:ADP-L-glycero-D-manno-heptose 6-epimerase
MSNPRQAVVVTGGAGFIGSNIVAALAAKGQPVVVIDWFGTSDKWRNIAKHEIADIVAPDNMMAWLKSNDWAVRSVVHMGAVSSTTERDADLIVERNFRTSLRLWDWCTEHRKPFIYASSAATYGDGAQGFDDDAGIAALSRLRPLNAYGWSKHAFDRRVARLVAEGKSTPPQWAGLKFFNVYGPNEYHKDDMMSVVAKAHAVASAGEPVRLFRSHRADYADGEQLRDFIHVGDCVEVVLWLLDRVSVSGLFNVGTGQARSFRDLANAVFAALGREPNIEYIDMPEDIRDRYQYFTEARMDRLLAAGFDRPFTSLEDGVADYVSRYLSKDDPYR